MSNPEVPLLDMKAQYSTLRSEIQEAVERVFETQHFILGPEVQQLEREVADYCGAAYGIGCASGSDALLLALMVCGVGPGDEVVTTPFTFFATASAIVRLAARPVFVDIQESTFNMDPGQLEAAISPRTKAVLPIHLFGQCADMNRINSIARAHGILVVEDSAQAIGAECDGKRAGSLGSISAFSFYPSKNLGGAGDGGMLTTDDVGFAETGRILRSHGAKKKYYHDLVGINSRLDALQAAILRVKLKYLDEWALKRRANAARYRTLFDQSGLVARGCLKLPTESAGCHHVYNQFCVRVDNRDALRAFLQEQGIGTEIYYPLPLHLQPCFSELGYRSGEFPQSEQASREVLAIPIHPELGESAQSFVVESVATFFKSGAPRKAA